MANSSPKQSPNNNSSYNPLQDKNVIYVGMGLLALFLVIFALLIASDDRDKNYLNEQPRTEQISQQGRTYLFSSAEDFRQSFNSFSRANNFELEIGKLRIEQGSVHNAFQYMFTDLSGIIGTVRKSDNAVIAVSTLFGTDGSQRANDDMLVCLATIESIVDPNLSPADKEKINNGLGLFSGHPSGSITINGIKWYSNEVGQYMYFGAELP